jgi:hypothetical protein
MMVYPGQTLTWTSLGQLYAALWDSQSQPTVIQPGIKPGSVGTPLAMKCSASDCCATREVKGGRGDDTEDGIHDYNTEMTKSTVC